MNIHLKTISLVLLWAATCGAQRPGDGPTERERLLLERIDRLEERIAVLESKVAGSSAPQPATSQAETKIESATETGPSSWLKDTTINAYFDGYYVWNTSRPLDRTNLLRAYDHSANSFSINQTGLVVERAPNPGDGRRWGYRLDLMYGHATETLQGSAQNEPRPQVYRNLFQAYGTYVVPVGKGLTVDFGKWASALGFENNYTKDQINYSRSYFFTFLPYYHMGFRTSYSLNGKVGVGYWLVNGANQTEDFNGFKSQLVQLNLKPAKTVSWTLQYYAGREQRDLVPRQNGRFHIVDTYGTWNAAPKLMLSAELDYAINRVQTTSPPRVVAGGAAYLKYHFTPRFYFGQRYVRLSDRAGLFSGARQNLNDLTSTFTFRPAEGFETRFEYRRDFSNAPFFLTATPGHFRKDQNTLALGLLWWLGGKQGAW